MPVQNCFGIELVKCLLIQEYQARFSARSLRTSRHNNCVTASAFFGQCQQGRWTDAFLADPVVSTMVRMVIGTLLVILLAVLWPLISKAKKGKGGE